MVNTIDEELCENMRIAPSRKLSVQQKRPAGVLRGGEKKG